MVRNLLPSSDFIKGTEASNARAGFAIEGAHDDAGWLDRYGSAAATERKSATSLNNSMPRHGIQGFRVVRAYEEVTQVVDDQAAAGQRVRPLEMR